jgi:hypothetical protein
MSVKFESWFKRRDESILNTARRDHAGNAALSKEMPIRRGFLASADELLTVGVGRTITIGRSADDHPSRL